MNKSLILRDVRNVELDVDVSECSKMQMQNGRCRCQ